MLDNTNPYKNCLLCPRFCGINRSAGERGFCGETSDLRVSFAGIHNGEEPPIKGEGGSGTIFITGCNLGCIFCQCFQVSQGNEMCRTVDTAEFAEMCLALQEMGAENINIVTGSHVAPAIAAGFKSAREQGLIIPALWNSSGYDGEQTLEIIKDFVDVYLPDLKTLDKAIAVQFSNAPDYPECAAAAILKMMEFRPLRFGRSSGKSAAENVMLSGVMIRHLIIPGFLENTRQVLRWFAEHCNGSNGGGNGSGALLSLMTQYTPAQAPTAFSSGTKAGDMLTTNVPNRYVSSREYDAVLAMLDELGITNGFCQELVSEANWLPDFALQNPFPQGISVPLWHWKT